MDVGFDLISILYFDKGPFGINAYFACIVLLDLIIEKILSDVLDYAFEDLNSLYNSVMKQFQNNIPL